MNIYVVFQKLCAIDCVNNMYVKCILNISVCDSPANLTDFCVQRLASHHPLKSIDCNP